MEILRILMGAVFLFPGLLILLVYALMREIRWNKVHPRPTPKPRKRGWSYMRPIYLMRFMK